MTAQRSFRPAIVVIAAITVVVLAAAGPANAQPRRGVERANRINSEPPLEVPRSLPSSASLAGITIDPAVAALAIQLDAQSYAHREAATQRLLDMPVDIGQLCKLLDDPHISPEQRYRLLAVVREKLVDAPRGALGISMSRQPPAPGDPGGIEITQLVPGMPAEDALRRSDWITHINGRRLVGQRDLQILVQSRAPGDVIDLRVSRPVRDDKGHFVRDDDSKLVYEQVEVQLELGSYEDLNNGPFRGTASAGPVGSQRIADAAEATERFTPRSVPIEIENADNVNFLGPSAGGFEFGPIEEHVLVRGLQRDLDLINRGRIARPQREAKWQAQIDDLIRKAAEPGRTPEELRYVNRVIRRLQEMVGGER